MGFWSFGKIGSSGYSNVFETTVDSDEELYSGLEGVRVVPVATILADEVFLIIA